MGKNCKFKKGWTKQISLRRCHLSKDHEGGGGVSPLVAGGRDALAEVIHLRQEHAKAAKIESVKE